MKNLSLKFSELELIFIQITGSTVDGSRGLIRENKTIGGLVNEQITLGAKVRLRKIANIIQSELKPFYEQKSLLDAEFKGVKFSKEKNEEYTSKLDEIDIPVNINFEPVSMEISRVEEVISNIDYSFAVEHLFISTSAPIVEIVEKKEQ
jgi:hypothetical protein